MLESYRQLSGSDPALDVLRLENIDRSLRVVERWTCRVPKRIGGRAGALEALAGLFTGKH